MDAVTKFTSFSKHLLYSEVIEDSKLVYEPTFLGAVLFIGAGVVVLSVVLLGIVFLGSVL